MVYVDKGNVIALTDGVGGTLTQGQVIFHEPGEVHAHISDGEVANNMLVVSFDCGSEAMSFFRKKTFTLDKTCRTLLSLFMTEASRALDELPNRYDWRGDLDFSGEGFGASQLMNCLYTEFLIRLIRSGTESGSAILPNSESRLIARNSTVSLIENYLREQVRSDISLAEVCRHFYLGKTQLTRIFRENTGKRPMEYYAELKMEEAKKLLREGNESVSRIADLLGYSSVHNFSRAFKKAVGFSPTAYEKSILSRQSLSGEEEG